MEITRHNFKKNLPSIKEAIRTANFISIDGEFTGISSQRTVNHFDTPEERYQKLKEGNGSSYLLIQFGLCTFHYNEDTDSYQHKAFNFYIFPHRGRNPRPEDCFLSQPSSLEFLASQGFDFNKLIHDGVTYLATDRCLRIKARLQEKHQDQLKQLSAKPSSPLIRNNIVIPEEHVDFIKKMEDEIAELMSSKDQETLDLRPCNSFLRRLVYEMVQEKFPTVQLTTMPVPDSTSRFLRVAKKNQDPDFYKEELKVKQKKELLDLEDSVGFCKVIEAISEANTLMVGHNMLLDIINILRQFVCPLPESYMEFKSLVKCALNTVIDTKLIASSEPFKDHIRETALQDLVNRLQSKPFKLKNIEPLPGFPGYLLNEGKLHEAGFDAYITGAALIGLHQHLCKTANVSEPISRASKMLAPYLNKVFMMQSYDLTYLDLGKDDALPPRNQVFYVKFPSDWKTKDLIDLFIDYGNVFISWVSDTSAYVCLRDISNVQKVCQKLVKQSMGQQYSVVPYKDMKQCNSSSQRKHSREEEAATPPPHKKLRTCHIIECLSSQDASSSQDLTDESSEEEKLEEGATAAAAAQLFEEPKTWE